MRVLWEEHRRRPAHPCRQWVIGKCVCIVSYPFVSGLSNHSLLYVILLLTKFSVVHLCVLCWNYEFCDSKEWLAVKTRKRSIKRLITDSVRAPSQNSRSYRTKARHLQLSLASLCVRDSLHSDSHSIQAEIEPPGGQPNCPARRHNHGPDERLRPSSKQAKHITE